MSEEDKKPEPETQTMEAPEGAEESSDEAPACPGDVAIPGPELPNGDRLCIAHHNHETRIGVLQKMRPGEPLPDHAHLVSPIEGTPMYEIGESVADLKRGGKGPAKVNSKAYREGYDRIFGKKEIGQA